MPTRPLEATLKIAVLEALVEDGYDVGRAARSLGVSTSTLYKKLRRWNLQPPMWASSPGGKVLRRDFQDRCEAILEALGQIRRLG